jgi:hypothetical protein
MWRSLSTRRQVKRKGYIYAASSEARPDIIKIGYSSDVRRRLKKHNTLLMGLGISPLVLLFYVAVDDCVGTETAIHLHLQDYCTTKDALGFEEVGSRELFEVDAPTVRRVFALAGEVVDGTGGCEFLLRRKPRPAPGRSRFMGGYPLYVWLRDHHLEIKERQKDPAFSWPQLAYEASAALSRPGRPFVGYSPAEVRLTWGRANYMETTYGPNPFTLREAPEKVAQ